jgi:hypothetical protein
MRVEMGVVAMPVISAPGRLRQEDGDFQASLGYPQKPIFVFKCVGWILILAENSLQVFGAGQMLKTV